MLVRTFNDSLTIYRDGSPDKTDPGGRDWDSRSPAPCGVDGTGIEAIMARTTAKGPYRGGHDTATRSAMWLLRREAQRRS